MRVDQIQAAPSPLQELQLKAFRAFSIAQIWRSLRNAMAGCLIFGGFGFGAAVVFYGILPTLVVSAFAYRAKRKFEVNHERYLSFDENGNAFHPLTPQGYLAKPRWLITMEDAHAENACRAAGMTPFEERRALPSAHLQASFTSAVLDEREEPFRKRKRRQARPGAAVANKI